MTDITFYSQIIVFVLNIVVFCFLMNERDMSYKLARIILLVAISVGAVINFGKVTVFTLIFSFSPLITLIKIRQHGKIYRIIERVRNHFRGHKQHIQNL